VIRKRFGESILVRNRKWDGKIWTREEYLRIVYVGRRIRGSGRGDGRESVGSGIRLCLQC
jgi:hypothetical protein